MTDVLPDPCSECGFDSRGLHPPDLVATLRSLGRRWAGVLTPDRPGATSFAEGALDGLLEAARPIRAEVGRFGTRPEASAEGIATAAQAIADALEGPDEPIQRPGVEEAAIAAAHAGTHYLRLAATAKAPQRLGQGHQLEEVVGPVVEGGVG